MSYSCTFFFFLQWNGKTCNKDEKFTALQYVQKLKVRIWPATLLKQYCATNITVGHTHLPFGINPCIDRGGGEGSKYNFIHASRTLCTCGHWHVNCLCQISVLIPSHRMWGELHSVWSLNSLWEWLILSWSQKHFGLTAEALCTSNTERALV